MQKIVEINLVFSAGAPDVPSVLDVLILVNSRISKTVKMLGLQHFCLRYMLIKITRKLFSLFKQ